MIRFRYAMKVKTSILMCLSNEIERNVWLVRQIFARLSADVFVTKLKSVYLIGYKCCGLIDVI